MISRRTTGLASILVAGLALFASPAFAQSEKATETADKLETAVKQKKAEEAVSAINELIGIYIDAPTENVADRKVLKENEKTRSVVIDALTRALKFPDPQVVTIAAQGLGGMGEGAAKPLAAALDDRRLRKEEVMKPAYLQIIRSLGLTKSERQVKKLTNLLNDKDNEVIAAAGEALGNFGSDVRLNTRKMVAEELIKTLTSAFSIAESDPRNTTAKRKYEVISIPLMTALQRVTGAAVGTPPEWRKWYNDNKKKRWD